MTISIYLYFGDFNGDDAYFVYAEESIPYVGTIKVTNGEREGRSYQNKKLAFVGATLE